MVERFIAGVSTGEWRRAAVFGYREERGITGGDGAPAGGGWTHWSGRQGPGKVMDPIEFASTDSFSGTSGKLVAYPGAWSVADAFGKNAE
jgi:hypothetical protein